MKTSVTSFFFRRGSRTGLALAALSMAFIVVPVDKSSAVITTPGLGATTQPLGSPGTFSNLVFNDSFTGPAVDTNSWEPGWLSQPTDTYSSCDVTVGKQYVGGTGGLFLSSEGVGTSKTIAGTPCPAPSGSSASYQGGAIQGKFSFTYGYVEAKIWLPSISSGKIANWPALWLFNGNAKGNHQEIDIMEGLGGLAGASVHMQVPTASLKVDHTQMVAGDFTGWHTYGADWEQGSTKFYYDGKLVYTYTGAVGADPMYPILNYAANPAVASSWVATTTKNYERMQVSYVRIWQNTVNLQSTPALGNYTDPCPGSTSLTC